LRTLVLWISICLVLLCAAGCAGSKGVIEGDEELIHVVTTIYPLADILEQLGGERVAVSYLLPAGASPHTYEPTVEQARLIANAQLFVYIGAGLDEWAVKLTETAGQGLTVVELAGALDLLESGHYYHLDEDHDAHHHDEHHDDEHGHEEADHSHHDHDHGPDDPHFWLDPLVVRDQISPRLYEELAALSPEHAIYFEERLDNYRQQLTLLNEEIAAAVSGFSKRNFIAFHSGWQYFAQRYGLREVAVIAEFPGQEPSSGWVARLVELIKENQIGAILTEPQFSSALAERIAEESGSKVLVIDPLGGENVPGRESYLELMRFNLGAFKEALQ
jgi:zinc transport system substrate-binding protein